MPATIVGLPTGLSQTNTIDTPQTVQLDKLGAQQHGGNQTVLSPDHIYHMTVVEAHNKHSFVILKATPNTMTAEVFSQYQRDLANPAQAVAAAEEKAAALAAAAAETAKEKKKKKKGDELDSDEEEEKPAKPAPALMVTEKKEGEEGPLAIMHESKFRTCVAEVYEPGTKVRVMIKGCVYGKTAVEVQAASADGSIPAVNAKPLEYLVVEEVATRCYWGRCIRRNKTSTKAFMEIQVPVADEFDKDYGMEEDEVSSTSRLLAIAKATPVPSPHATYLPLKPAVPTADGKKPRKPRAIAPPVVEVGLSREGTRLEDVTSKVPPFPNPPLPRVGERCLLGVTGTTKGGAQAVCLDYPYSSTGSKGVAQLTTDLEVSELGSDAVTNCLMEGIETYEGDDCSAVGLESDEEEEEDDEETKAAKKAEEEEALKKLPPVFQIVYDLYSNQEEEPQEEEGPSEAMRALMAQMEEAKEREEREARWKKKQEEIRAKIGQNTQTQSSKNKPNPTKAAMMSRPNIPMPKQEEQPMEPEKSPLEKMNEVSADFEKLQAPAIKAGGVTKLGDMERKLFFELSMKLLYRLDALQGLEQDMREKRKSLVLAIKDLQDEAKAGMEDE